MADHGTHARYAIGHCRCWPCRLAHSDYNTNREKQIAFGRWEKFTPAEPVRAHVRSLMAQGVGWRRVALLADVAAGTVTRLLYGTGKRRTLPAKVRVETAERLMVVRVDLSAFGSTTAIDGTGTRRRLQALVAVGWSQAKIGARLGIAPTGISRMLYSERVTAASAVAVRSVYDQLWNEQVPEEEWRDKIAASRARRYAAERGWVPPLAWDDEAIDDPAAVPEGAGFVSSHGKLPPPEDIAWLIAGGDSLEVLADRYGATVKGIKKQLRRAVAA